MKPRWWQITIYAVAVSPVIIAASDIIANLTAAWVGITLAILATLAAGWFAEDAVRLVAADLREVRRRVREARR